MTPNSCTLSHALVLQFLELNKYHKTLNAFREEANEVIAESGDEFRRQPEKTLKDLVEEHLVSQLGNKLNAFSLQRHFEGDLNTPGDNRIPRFLYDHFSQIHDGNVLTVRIQTLPVKNFDEDEYIESQVSTIVTSSADKTVRFTALLTGDTYKVSQVHQGGVLTLDFHPHYPTLMLTGSMDATAALVDVMGNTTLQTFKDHSKYVVHARFSPDGTLFVTASYDHTLNFYKMAPPQTPITPTTPSSPKSPNRMHLENISYTFQKSLTFTGNIEALCFLPDNQYLVVGIREDNYLHYIDINTFSDTKYNMNQNGDDWISFTPMHISPSPHNNGKYLLVSTDDSNGRLILFRTHSSQQLRNFYGVDVDKFSTPRHCWHPSGKYIYATDDKRCICVIDVSKGIITEKLEGHTAVIRDIWFDTERELLVSCDLDKSVRVWGCDDVASDRSDVSSEN